MQIYAHLTEKKEESSIKRVETALAKRTSSQNGSQHIEQAT